MGTMTKTATCPDCGVPIDVAHGESCDIAVCLATGEQRLVHEMLGDSDCCGADVWAGSEHGEAECEEYGWWTHIEGHLIPDLGRLRTEARWDARASRWTKR